MNPIPYLCHIHVDLHVKVFVVFKYNYEPSFFTSFAAPSVPSFFTSFTALSVTLYIINGCFHYSCRFFFRNKLEESQEETQRHQR